jgi:signal transduction histidine kinase
MRALIESLLMYSRSGAGPHRITSVDLEEVTRAASWTFRDVVDDARATLDIGSMPRVEGDETQLVQVMRNLVGNALKFVHPDIPVQVRIDAECDDEGWCVVSVVDTGIGIRPEHCERVFLPFHRVETGLRHAGTGLGLSICRRIVERHGGSIWVDEVPTGGTCIRFSLPLARDPK